MSPGGLLVMSPDVRTVHVVAFSINVSFGFSSLVLRSIGKLLYLQVLEADVVNIEENVLNI